MYIKDIYQDWELHQDATQLEIKYKFFVKYIDILNVKSLIKNENKNFQNQIIDSSIIKNWQSHNLSKVVKEFIQISSYKFPESKWFKDEDIFVRSMFISSNILLTLKETNYKCNDLEIYYEPVLFKLAQKILKPAVLDEWVSMMNQRVFETKSSILEPITLDINLNEKNINNVMWYFENLCLSFKDITNWYQRLFAIKDIAQDEKELYINIMNHMIVYNLSDFYIKLNSLNDKKPFNDLYNWVLASIGRLINDGKFAIKAFKAIANFLSKLLQDKYIDKDDHIINDFLLILKVSSSKANYEKLEENIMSGLIQKTEQFTAQSFLGDLANNENNTDELETKDLGDEENQDAANNRSSLSFKSFKDSQNKGKGIKLKQVIEPDNEEFVPYNNRTDLFDGVNKKRTSPFDEVDKDDEVQVVVDKKKTIQLTKLLDQKRNKTKKIGEKSGPIDDDDFDEISLGSEGE